jgi:transcriptional regulator with AAA-type ATPase domain
LRSRTRHRPDAAAFEPDHSCATELARRLFALSTSSRRAGRPLALIGQHPSLVDVQQRLLRFAEADAPVLIQGETGTGKELFARALHLLSSRRAETYISINCAQHQDGTLSVSELFGHRQGSFTGASTDHSGLFQAAHRGTLFLDEIGDAPPVMQGLILRGVGEGEILPLGG